MEETSLEQKVKSEITRTKILAAAETAFVEKGFAAANVDQIAQNAGVNKRMVYAHFGNKEGLYKHVLQVVYARRAEYEKQLERMDFDSPDCIRRAITMYFDFLMKNENFVRLLLWENLEYAKHIDKEEENFWSGIEVLLKKGRKHGLVRADIDIKQTALSCNMFCFSAFSNLHTLSKILAQDLTSEESLCARREHIADVLVRFITNESNF